MAHLEQIKGQCVSVPCYIIKGALEKHWCFQALLMVNLVCGTESETELLGPVS